MDLARYTVRRLLLVIPTLIGITLHSLTDLVLAVVAVDAVLTAALLVLSLRHLQDEAPATA